MQHISKEFFKKSITYYEEEKFNESLILIENIISMEDATPEVWYYKGLILKELKNYPDALNAIEKAEKSSSEENFKIELSLEKAKILGYIGCYLNAIEILTSLMTKNIDLTEIKEEMEKIKNIDGFLETSKGHSYFQSKDFSKALTCFQYYLQKNPMDKVGWRLLGMTYQKLKKYDDALASYDKAIKLGEEKALELRLKCQETAQKSNSETKKLNEDFTELKKQDGEKKNQSIGWAFVIITFISIVLYHFIYNFILEKNLDSEDVTKKNIAIYKLAQNGDKNACDKIIYLLQNDSNPSTRSMAASSLGQLGEPKAVQPLIKALKDPDRNVRQAVVQALGLLKAKEAILPMEELLNKESNSTLVTDIKETLNIIKGK